MGREFDEGDMYEDNSFLNSWRSMSAREPDMDDYVSFLEDESDDIDDGDSGDADMSSMCLVQPASERNALLVPTDKSGVLIPTPTCPNCSKQMVRRSGINGEFWGCRSYPACKGSRDFVTSSGHPAKKCPSCGGTMVSRSGPRGKFWGCSGFPNCRGSRSV